MCTFKFDVNVEIKTKSLSTFTPSASISMLIFKILMLQYALLAHIWSSVRLGMLNKYGTSE